jgi:hypothetical protein
VVGAATADGGGGVKGATAARVRFDVLGQTLWFPCQALILADVEELGEGGHGMAHPGMAEIEQPSTALVDMGMVEGDAGEAVWLSRRLEWGHCYRLFLHAERLPRPAGGMALGVLPVGFDTSASADVAAACPPRTVSVFD